MTSATPQHCRGIDHLHINVSDIRTSGPFYDRLLQYFGFTTLEKAAAHWWWHNGGSHTFGIEQTPKKFLQALFHRKQTGLNHIAFRAKTQHDVDVFYEKVLLPYHVPILYGGPRVFPEYHKTYYAVFFEDPDRIKLEFMWLEDKQ